MRTGVRRGLLNVVDNSYKYPKPNNTRHCSQRGMAIIKCGPRRRYEVSHPVYNPIKPSRFSVFIPVFDMYICHSTKEECVVFERSILVLFPSFHFFMFQLLETLEHNVQQSTIPLYIPLRSAMTRLLIVSNGCAAVVAHNPATNEAAMCPNTSSLLLPNKYFV